MPASHLVINPENLPESAPRAGRSSPQSHLIATGYQHCDIAGQSWVFYKGILTPAAPPHRTGPQDPAVIERAVAHHDAWGALWTSDWNSQRSPWFYMVCDDPGYSIDKISSASARRGTRLGLQRTQIRRTTADWIAANAFEVHDANFA